MSVACGSQVRRVWRWWGYEGLCIGSSGDGPEGIQSFRPSTNKLCTIDYDDENQIFVKKQEIMDVECWRRWGVWLRYGTIAWSDVCRFGFELVVLHSKGKRWNIQLKNSNTEEFGIFWANSAQDVEKKRALSLWPATFSTWKKSYFAALE